MLDSSSTKEELEDRRHRLGYNSACLNFFLNEFKDELKKNGLLDDSNQASIATPHEEMMTFLVELDQVVRDRVSSDPTLGYLELYAPDQPSQGIEKLKLQIAWLERLLSSLQGEIKIINDILSELSPTT